MSQTTPPVADTPGTEEAPPALEVRVILSMVDDADLEAALAVVARQVYEPSPQIVVVGPGDLDVPDGIDRASTLEEAINSVDAEVDYLWLLHADARPRPDALSALVNEIERNDAALAGSKLLRAGTMDELESIGGATDVFGEPYSGLDEGEIDLQQYDVVREVAFVTSASMLVRRDLAQGLKGLDPLLPPVAAGLDFSQRTRLAGGKVVTVPSSEVYHQARCGEGGTGRKEQAGRLRAMLTAYSPLTLLWVVPYDLLVGVVDSLASLLLLRWRPAARHFYSWAWNLFRLPSTVMQRRRFRPVRSQGDEELFRFQARGSVRLRSIAQEVSARVLSVFDEDQALARGTRRLWGSPGIWGAIVAVTVAAVGARSLIFGGMPDFGFSFPFESPSISLDRWFGGWNDAGLGAGTPVHPSVGLTGLISFLSFGAPEAARVIMTIAFALSAVVGVGRLAGRVGLRGPGRYLAGLALIAGPGTSVLTGRGSWLALGAAATLPWAVRAAFLHEHDRPRSRLTLIGWALLLGALVGFFAPPLTLVPLVIVTIWRLLGGGSGARFGLALCTAGGLVVGAAFLIGDPGWVLDDARRLGLEADALWPALILAASAPLYFSDGPRRTLGLTGGVVGLGALAAGLAPGLGPGIEEALLVTASLGTAMVVAAALDRLKVSPSRVFSAVAALAIVVVSAGVVGNGRLGLAGGDENARLAFATTLSRNDAPGRVLIASVDPTLIAGEPRPGPGYWFRLVDGEGMTHDEVWLPEAGRADDRFSEALTAITSGADLRPGDRLAEFAVDWVVLYGPEFRLDDVLGAQLDLVPTPLDPDARIYENPGSAPLAGNEDVVWSRSGPGFAGPVSGEPVRLAVAFDTGWQPGAARDDWAVTVDGADGVAGYGRPAVALALPIASIALLLGAFSLIVVGRRRR